MPDEEDASKPCESGKDAAEERFLALRCNFPSKDGNSCTAALTEGWATSCSHLFCSEHANEWFSGDDRCPVCLDKQGRVRMVKVGAPKTKRQQVHTLMIGHNPCDAQLAATTAINFWTEQKKEEFHRHLTAEKDTEARVKRLVGAGRKQLAEAESLHQSLEAGVEELRRQLSEAHHRLRQSKEEAAKLQSRCGQVQRAYKDALSRAAGVSSRLLRSGEPDAHGDFGQDRRVQVDGSRQFSRDAGFGSVSFGSARRRSKSPRRNFLAAGPPEPSSTRAGRFTQRLFLN